MKTTNLITLKTLLVLLIASWASHVTAQRGNTTTLSNNGSPHQFELQSPQNQNLPAVHIDDSRAPGTMVNISEEMYGEILGWMLEGSRQQQGLSDFLSQSHDTTEVGEFMDKFYNGDHSYFTGGGSGGTGGTKGGGGGVLGGGNPPPPPPPAECKCKYLTFTPSSPQYGIVDADPATEGVLDNDFGSGWQLHRRGMGAGQMGYIATWASGGPDVKRNFGPFELDSKTRMKIMYLCTDENELPDDCGCDKTIHVEGEYRNKLYADADESGIFNRDAKAKVEVGIMMVDYAHGENFAIIDIPTAAMRAAYAKKEVSWDPNFKMKVIDLAKSAVTGVISGGANFNDLLSDATDLIGDLVANDSLITNTTDAVAPVTLNKIAGGSLTLSPGTERIIMMTALTHYESEVKTGWTNSASAEAMMGSSYRLHAFLNYDNTNPDCCTEKYGMWAYGGYDMSISSSGYSWSWDPSMGDLLNLKNSLVTNFVGPWDNFNPDAFYGTTGSSAQTCECNVRPDIDLLSKACDNVVIDISGTQFANNYVLMVQEIDEDGEHVPGTWASTGWVSSLPNVINLTNTNSPLGSIYNFDQGKTYKISLAVSGHCTGWTSTAVIFELDDYTVAKFKVNEATCDAVTIDISGTDNADEYFLSVRKVDANGNYVCCYQSTGWVASLPTLMDLSTNFLNWPGYAFEAGDRYMIQVAAKGSCTNWVADEKFVNIDATAVPAFTLNPKCNEILFDGSDSENETKFKLILQEINIFGNPIGNPVDLTGGYVNGQVGAYDLMQVYTGFTAGASYRLTLIVNNACSGDQELTEDFTYSFEPVADFTVPNPVCEGDDVWMNMTNSLAADEFKIEIFESSQFGQPTGPVIDFTGGWVPAQNPNILLSDPNIINLIGTKWYTVRLYVRNSCSPTEDMEFSVFRVLAPSDCIIVQAPTEKVCKAEFGVITPTNGGTEVDLIDLSETEEIISRRTWSFGDGLTETSSISPTHTYAASGSYVVRLTIETEGGCTSYKDVTVNLGSRKKVAEVNTPGFDLYPNPVKGRLHVNYELTETSNASLKIYDLIGKVVAQQQLDVANTETTISTSDLANGLYIVSITADGKQLFKDKIIVTN